MCEDTGIGLFVFDRPDHTRRVLDGLAENEIEHLYVFADGPLDSDEHDLVKETRDVVDNIDFCDVDMIVRSENLGVQESWVKAYDYIFNKHDSAIMLEDDCVPSPDFVSYMRSCLNRYESVERVMNIHGYCPPISIPDEYPYDVYFTWRSGSWGQATWKSAWEKLERDPKVLTLINQDQELRQRVSRAGSDLVPMIRNEIRGEIDSIGVWWSLTLAINNAVSVNPISSKIKNIGHDGSGRHSSNTNRYMTSIEPDDVDSDIQFPPSISVDRDINKRYNHHIQGGLRGKAGRLLERIRWHVSLDKWLSSI